MKKIANHSSSPASTAALSAAALASVDGGGPMSFFSKLGRTGSKAESTAARTSTTARNPVTGSEGGQSFWNKVGDATIFGTGFAGTGLVVDNLFGPDDEATAQMMPPLPAL